MDSRRSRLLMALVVLLGMEVCSEYARELVEREGRGEKMDRQAIFLCCAFRAGRSV